MAETVKITATDITNKHFEAELVELAEWHAIMTAGDARRTVCGIQLDGDDGYCESEPRQGKVTCQLCRAIIGEIQEIKRWR